MASYMLLLGAYVYDVLGIGLIGTRGRIVLAMIGAGQILAAVEYMGWHKTSGLVGVLLGTVTVVVVRRLGKWMAEEGGAATVWEWLGVLTERVLIALGQALRLVLAPPARKKVSAEVLAVQYVAQRARDIAAVALPHGDRWNLFGEPMAQRETPVLTPPVAPELHSVETYSDWLARAVQMRFTDAVDEAARLFQVSRSKFARDRRAALDGKAA